jgi:long-chain acyl-CoA synthetase
VNAVMSVSAPLDGEVRASLERSTAAHVAEGYAPLSSPMTHCNPLGAQRKAGTIGLPLPSTYAAVFDPETRTKLLPAGEIGELAVRGPQVMRGYWMDPRATAEVLHEGWFFTGDRVLSDDDGFFSLAGDSEAGAGRPEPDGAGNEEPLPAVTP